MAEVCLKPLHALLGATPRHDRIGAVTIRENPALTLATLATRRGQAAQVNAVARGLGLDLPGPGRDCLTLRPNRAALRR